MHEPRRGPFKMKVSLNASPEHRDIQKYSDPVKVAQRCRWAQNCWEILKIGIRNHKKWNYHYNHGLNISG